MQIDASFKKMMWASVAGSFLTSGIILVATWGLRRLGVSGFTS